MTISAVQLPCGNEVERENGVEIKRGEREGVHANLFRKGKKIDTTLIREN